MVADPPRPDLLTIYSATRDTPGEEQAYAHEEVFGSQFLCDHVPSIKTKGVDYCRNGRADNRHDDQNVFPIRACILCHRDLVALRDREIPGSVPFDDIIASDPASIETLMEF